MSRYDFYLFQNGQDPAADASVNIPAAMLNAINFKHHFIVAIRPGHAERPTYLRNEEDLLDWQAAEERALAWADKPLSESPTGWRFFSKKNGGSAPQGIEEADIALVDFDLGCVVAEHTDGTIKVLETLDDVRSFWGEEPAALEPSESDAVAKAIDPSHYKGYIEEMQWIDAMSKIPSLRKPERFIAALELQIRKYMDRNGAKDLTIQEWKKARFYMVYLVAYIDNDYVCIPVTEIQNRIKGL